MSDLTLITQYGDTRLTTEILDRDQTDYSDALITLTTYGSIRVSLDASEARKLASKLLDHADELDRQNTQ